MKQTLFQLPKGKYSTTMDLMFQGKELPLSVLQRKNQAKIGDPDKNTFINGINLFNLAAASPVVGGTYPQLVSIHRHPWHRMHSSNGELGTGSTRCVREASK